jgi:hypothetical protein
MKRPIESDYTSHVAYTRALEEYCDSLPQLAQEPEPHECTYGYSDCRALAIANTAQRTWVGSGDLEDSNAYQTPPTAPVQQQK